MAGTELAKAYVQIIPSMQGIKGRLAEGIGSEGTTAGNSFSSMFKKAVMAGGIGLTIKKVLSDAFTEGGELQQNLGGTEAVFGQYASNIQKYATDAYKNMGMSASDYMATANKMGSLFQGSGIEQQKALDMTSAAMQRAADVASVMGIDTAWAMESIAGAAKGNFTMMDNLGVAMNATTLQAYALEKGINFEWNTASNAEKAELAMKMFMDRTTQYAGNFARESEQTWTGSIGAMKAAYQNLMGNLMMGNDLKPSLSALGDTVKTFVTGNLVPAVANIITGIPTILVSIIPDLAMSLEGAGIEIVTQLGQSLIQGGPSLFASALSLIQSLADGFMLNVPKIYEVASNLIEQMRIGLQTYIPNILTEGGNLLVNLVNGILSNIPYLITGAGNLIVQFAGAIMSSFPQILQVGADLLVNIVTGIVNNLPQIVVSAINIVTRLRSTIAQNLPQILQSGIEIIGKLAAGLIRAIPNLISQIPQIIQSIKDTFLQTDWLSIGMNIISGIASGLANAGGMLWDAVKGVLGSFKDQVLSFFGIHSPSTWGIYVGDMIMRGIGLGGERGKGFLSKMMFDVKDSVTKPLDFRSSYGLELRGTGYREQTNGDLLQKLDRIIYLLEILLEKDVINEVNAKRAIIRLFRDWGIVFA